MKRLFGLLLVILLCAGFALAEDDIGAIEPKYPDGVMYVPVGKELEVKYRRTTTELRNSYEVYTLSDDSIAKVDYQGNVRGLKEGECTLTITSKRYPEVSATVTLRVIQAVKKIVMEEREFTLNNGENLQLEWAIEPADASIQGVTFESSDPDVATVDETGLIQTQGRGTATISVKSADGNASTRISLTVRQLPESVSISKPEIVLAVGKNVKYRATVSPANANNRNVDWSSSDTSVATVNSGNIKAIGPGTAILTATCAANPAATTTMKVVVVQPIREIELPEKRYELGIGDTVQLSPIFTPEDATPLVNYYAENPYIVTIDENGLLTAIRGGETTVYVASQENDKRRASVEVYIGVKATGIRADGDVRVPVGGHIFGNVHFVPSDATDKRMNWESSDPSVATVTNHDRRPRIEGHKWGSAVLTGTSVDGGFTASFTVYVGSLHEAATVTKVQTGGSSSLVTLTNHSDMHLTSISLRMESGEDAAYMSEESTHAVDLAPGASTTLGLTVPTGDELYVAVSGWETDDGFYTNEGVMKNSYRLSPGLMDWKEI